MATNDLNSLIRDVLGMVRKKQEFDMAYKTKNAQNPMKLEELKGKNALLQEQTRGASLADVENIRGRNALLQEKIRGVSNADIENIRGRNALGLEDVKGRNDRSLEGIKGDNDYGRQIFTNQGNLRNQELVNKGQLDVQSLRNQGILEQQKLINEGKNLDPLGSFTDSSNSSESGNQTDFSSYDDGQDISPQSPGINDALSSLDRSTTNKFREAINRFDTPSVYPDADMQGSHLPPSGNVQYDVFTGKPKINPSISSNKELTQSAHGIDTGIGVYQNKFREVINNFDNPSSMINNEDMDGDKLTVVDPLTGKKKKRIDVSKVPSSYNSKLNEFQM